MTDGRGNRGGETPENRDRMDGMTRTLVNNGTEYREARRIARECALRQDGDLPGGSQKRDRR